MPQIVGVFFLLTVYSCVVLEQMSSEFRVCFSVI